MKAAILCPGPSLLDIRTYELSEFFSIAVNTAANICGLRVDAVCASDQRLFNGILTCVPTKHIDIVTSKNTTPVVLRNVAWKDCHITEFEGMRLYQEHKEVEPPNFTVQIAILYALHMGADEVQVYGSDMTNEPDAAGYTPNDPGARGPGRWDKERAALKKTIAFVESKGATVKGLYL